MPRGIDRYDEAIRQRQLWTPRVLRSSGLLLAWMDPSDLASIEGVAATNQQLFDKSGFQHHVNSGTGVHPPLSFTAWTPRPNKRVITGDGSTYYGEMNGTPSGAGAISYDSTNGLSVMGVAQQNGTAAIRAIIGGGSSGSPVLRWNADHTIFVVRSTVLGLLTTTMAGSTGFHILGFDTKVNLTRAWLNGVSEENATNPAFTQALSRIMTDVNGTRFNGAMGEWVVSYTLAANVRQCLEGYLAWEWGLVSNLAASHRFKNRPPLVGD